MSSCILDSHLSLADAARSVKDDCMTTITVVKNVVDLAQLFLPPGEVRYLEHLP